MRGANAELTFCVGHSSRDTFLRSLSKIKQIETGPAVTPSNTKVVRTRGSNCLASTVLKSQANALCTIQTARGVQT